MYVRYSASEFQYLPHSFLLKFAGLSILLHLSYFKVSPMRTRNLKAKRQIQKAKGDLLAQKWMTNLLAFILILLIVAFVILSIPAVKKQIVNFARIMLYGREKKPQRPQVAPVRLQNPLHFFIFALQGNSHVY